MTQDPILLVVTVVRIVTTILNFIKAVIDLHQTTSTKTSRKHSNNKRPRK
jgi:hypothetical protein